MNKLSSVGTVIGLLLICACSAEDGDDDLVVNEGGGGKADGNGESWSVMSRKGSTRLGHAVLPADMDGDGALDLVIGAPAASGKVHVYLAAEDGLSKRASWSLTGGTMLGRRLARLQRSGGDCVAVVAKVKPHVSMYCKDATTPTWALETVGGASPYNAWEIASGDFDGDKVSDLVVSDGGRFWAFRGGGGTLASSPAWSLETDIDGIMGTPIVVADFDQDGYDDVAFGGRDLRLYRGSSQGLAASPAWIGVKPPEASSFGKSLAAGDVNGDGLPDLVVGYEVNSRGRVAVFLGAGAAFDGPATTLSEAEDPNRLSRFGGTVAVDNLDGDGFADVIVGETARVLVYRGTPDGIAEDTAWQRSFADGSPNVTAAAADVDADGKSDIIVGEPEYAAPSGGGTAFDAGRVSVYSQPKLAAP